MTNLTTYVVTNMRVYRPSAKVAEANPERVYTVAGAFYTVKGHDAKGNPILSDVNSFASKNIDQDDVRAEGFALDIENGILTLATGTRGRKSFDSLSAEDIAAELAALRGDSVPDTEASA